MSDIKASERRLAAALDRIDYLLETAAPRREGAAPATAAPPDTTELQARLDEALAENKRLNAALEAAPPAAKGGAEDTDSSRLAQLADQAARLSEANEELVAANRGLIEAVAGKTDGVEAVAVALEAEVEALRSARAAEISQISDIMSELQRLLGESAASDAPFAADVVSEASASAEIVSFGDEGGVPELSREREPGFDAVYGDEGDEFAGDDDDDLNGAENRGG